MIDQGTIKRRVDKIAVGDLIDLEGDAFADAGRGNIEFDFEFARVDEIERDGVARIVLHTSQGSFGFPPEHEVAYLSVEGKP